ncbi:MAG: tetratricopeptide repeat protein [Candidatus Rokubacteria bacterium]|nr:tetratricopeptide repeat protein [Candidatus Rokubacteria bacterium]
MRQAAARQSLAILLVFLSLLPPLQAGAQQSEADVFVAQAILAYDDKRYDEALEYLREAVQQDPKNVEALYYTGLVNIALQRFEPAVQALERARTLAPDDFSVRFLLGVGYFAQERYEQAEPILNQCFRERPTTDGLGYYVGFMRYRKKDYVGAVEAFKGETSQNPAIVQLTHFYSGLALAVMGMPERAMSELDAATRGLAGSAITGPAERLRDAIAAGGGAGNRFHAEVRLGFTYDTNVKVLPNPSNDPLANEIRFFDTESRDGLASTKSPGELAAVTLSYDWLRYGNWESTIGYQFFQTLVNNFHDFDVQDQAVTLGGTYRGAFETGVLAGSRFFVGGQYAFDNQLLGGDQFLRRNTGALFGTVQLNAAGDSFWNPTHVFSPIIRVQGKNFTGIPLPVEEDRDAMNYMVGLSHTFYWSGDRHWFRVGYQWDTDVARGRNWSYRGNRVLAGVQYTLPWWQTRLGYNMDVHFTSYLHANSLFHLLPAPVKRADVEQTHVFALDQPLPFFVRQEAGATRAPMTLRIEYQLGVTSSNIGIYAYDRNVASVSISFQY